MFIKIRENELINLDHVEVIRVMKANTTFSQTIFSLGDIDIHVAGIPDEVRGMLGIKEGVKE